MIAVISQYPLGCGDSWGRCSFFFMWLCYWNLLSSFPSERQQSPTELQKKESVIYFRYLMQVMHWLNQKCFIIAVTHMSEVSFTTFWPLCPTTAFSNRWGLHYPLQVLLCLLSDLLRYLRFLLELLRLRLFSLLSRLRSLLRVLL